MQRTPKRHSFHPLLFASPQENGPKASSDNGPRSQIRLRVVDDAYIKSLQESPAAGVSLLESDEQVPPTLRGSVEWLEAQDLLDELAEDQLMLSMNLACLERASQSRPRDVSTRAALKCLDDRIADLLNMRDALAVLQLAAISKTVHRAFLPDAPLADYVRGVYAWLHSTVRALGGLAKGLSAMQPDWAGYRWRIEEAKNFHFDELQGAIEADLEDLIVESGDDEAVGVLAVAFDGLLDEARLLETQLEERFG